MNLMHLGCAKFLWGLFYMMFRCIALLGFGFEGFNMLITVVALPELTLC